MRRRTATIKKFKDGGSVRAEQSRRRSEGAPEEEGRVGITYNRLLSRRRDATDSARSLAEAAREHEAKFDPEKARDLRRASIAEYNAAAEITDGVAREGRRIGQARSNRNDDAGYKKGGLIKKPVAKRK